MVKTALKLLLVFVEYTESNATLLIEAVSVVDAKRGETGSLVCTATPRGSTLYCLIAHWCAGVEYPCVSAPSYPSLLLLRKKTQPDPLLPDEKELDLSPCG